MMEPIVDRGRTKIDTGNPGNRELKSRRRIESMSEYSPFRGRHREPAVPTLVEMWWRVVGPKRQIDRVRPLRDDSGARGPLPASEVLPRLTWDQIDTRAKLIRIDLGVTKAGEGRTFPITQTLETILKRCTKAKKDDCTLVFHQDGATI